ncbi:uncharacterized protein LOC123535587 isoform X1 [Mercenaria mercenaria]|uniref:uncharacterized protein LOC123535587 isoform X1 n=1 Tax=Mercenaria mercenaria TaxID=6596 RepID=UPI00234EF5D3|nr:uncharacterized protein LOC123535587 isoform X1 [Mercenaria mercenaria]XP_053405655.1 uncharacterized protein LOC123535587 isoform X1 [Mercenaria mercenaria]
MAYNWDGDEYGYHGYSIQPSVRLRLRNYEGPYDPATLMRARDELLYHVERTQNTAAWSRIQRKTPVNVNGIRDDDDGFGEASDKFSHAKLPESKEFEVPYQGCQIDTDNFISQQEPTCTVAAEGDKGEVIEIEDDDIDDVHESNEVVNSSEMETVTIEIDLPVTLNTSENADSDDSDCVLVEDNKDLITDEQIEIENETVKPADARDGLDKQETDEEDIENDTKFQRRSYESEEKMANTKVETVETNAHENIVLEEQNTESNTEDKVVHNEDENVKQGTLTMPCSESILKCDHCEVRCSDGKSMSEHLDTAVHYSASKYNVDNVGALILMKKVVKTNWNAKYKTTVMKCPIASCPSIFPQMDLCVNHYNEKHWKRGMQKGQYGLIDLVKEEKCSITLNPPKCCQCAVFCGTVDKLKRHMKDKGHYPFTLIENCNITFLCQYCERSFKHFDGLICHQRAHRNVTKHIFNFRVFQYESVRKFIIPEKGRLSQRSGSVAKRKHDQSYSDSEPNTKVKRTMVGTEVCVQICSETVDDEADSGHDVSESVTDGTEDNTEIYDAMREAMNHAKSVLSAVRSDSDSQAEKVDGADTLQNTFKCDFCMEINSSKEQMILHLNETCHRSASSVLTDGDKNVRYMKSLGSVVCTEGLRQKAYAACPGNCQNLFSSVKQSVEHYVLCHNNEIELKPCYGVIEVRDEVTIQVSPNKCLICGETFKKLKTLSMHFKAKHYPFSLKHGCETFFKCMYCPRIFHTFKSALVHVVFHKNLAKNGMLDISVLYINCSVKRIELPPKHSSSVDKWEAEIRSIQYCIRNLEATSKSIADNSAKRKMKKKIRTMKEGLVEKFC